jgi:hypothetical protein
MMVTEIIIGVVVGLTLFALLLLCSKALDGWVDRL